MPGTLSQKQVLDMDIPKRPFGILSDQRIPGVTILGNDPVNLVAALAQAEASHEPPGAHGVSNGERSHVEDVFQMQQPSERQRSARLGLVEDDSDLILAVGSLAGGGWKPEQAKHTVDR